jgi:hypothetical protein
MKSESAGDFHGRIRELERVMVGCTKTTPSDSTGGDHHQPSRRPFRLWTEPPLSSFETWLEIRARANLRTREEERQSVMDIRAKAPAVIEKVRSFRMFGHDTKGVRASSLREHLALSKRDRRKHTLDRVELKGGAWSSVAVLPMCAVDFLIKLEDRRWKAGGARACSDLLLDAVEACSPGLAAFVLHKEARVWSMPGADASSAEDGREWTRRLVEHVESLDHLKECARRGRQVLDELDEIESAWPMVHARHSRAWAPMRAELWKKTQDHPSLCNFPGLEAYRALSLHNDDRHAYDGHACEFAVKYDALLQWVQNCERLLTVHGALRELVSHALQHWACSPDLDGLLRRVQLEDLIASILGKDAVGGSGVLGALAGVKAVSVCLCVCVCVCVCIHVHP